MADWHLLSDGLRRNIWMGAARLSIVDGWPICSQTICDGLVEWDFPLNW
jgi:hypothetical protein